MLRLYKLCLRVCCAVIFSTAAALSSAAAPFAGSQIDNQAYAEFVGAAGLSVRVASNSVLATVGQIPGFVLSSAQERTSLPGGQVRLFHTLTNTGNGPDVFDLSLVNQVGAFDLTGIALYADVNGDGVPDNATPLSQTPLLGVGGSFNFVAVALVPPTALNGQRDSLLVSAMGNSAYASSKEFSPALVQTNTDGVTVTTGPLIDLVKSFSITQGTSPSSDILVKLRYRNNGFADATHVLISDVIGGAGAGFNTQGFTYVPHSARWNQLLLTDAPDGDPAGVSYQFETAGVFANTVRAQIQFVPRGAEGVLEFVLRAVSGLSAGSTTTRNVASASHSYNGVGVYTESNPATYTILGAEPGANLTLTKTAGALVVPGQCTTFNLRVSNVGTQTSTGVVRVTDVLPAGLEYLPSCSISGQMVQSGGVGWSCPSTPTVGSVSCTSQTNYPPAPQQGHAGQILTLVVRANAATLVPPLPAITAQPNTVTVLNRASVSNDSEPLSLRNDNDASASLLVGPAATLKGHVWLDSNHNRRRDVASDDKPMVGWMVEVLKNGVLVATAYTLPDGSYEVKGLLPGTYHVRFKDPQSNIVSGRPVCNEQGLPSQTASNCAKTDLSQQSSSLGPREDLLQITLQPGDTASELSLPLDPNGVVYDSITRAPVAGAVVSLQVPAGFNPAEHLIGGAAAMTQTTGSSGYYQFILTPAGAAFCASVPNGCVISLQITPPAGYLPPNSKFIPPSPSLNCNASLNCLDPTGLSLNGGVYAVQAQSSAPVAGQATPYYLHFRLTAGDPEVVNNHIPLDPLNAFGENLLIQKTASKAAAEVGDVVSYTVKIKNGGLNAVAQVKLIDTLPLGFKYVRGSTKKAGVAWGDPEDLGAGKLQWLLPLLAASQTLELSYQVRLTDAAARGDGINRVTAVCLNNALGGVCANTAQAKVLVQEGVLSGKPVLIGKVYLDCNRDRVQSEREVGIPGVRIFVQDGTYAVTDAEGKYSVYGLSARTHVLKLDPLTLPTGFEPLMLSNRHAGDAVSRFADLSLGELHKANFADGACHPHTVAEVHQRREWALHSSFEGLAGTGWDKPLELNAAPPAGDVRSKPAAGGQGMASLVNKDAGHGASPATALAAAQKTAPPQTAPEQAPPLGGEAYLALEKQLEKANNSLAFLNLSDGQVLPYAQATVQVKGVLGAVLKVSVNGQVLPESRIGKRSQNETAQVAGLEYVAVPMQTGSNQIDLEQFDTLGNPRGKVSLRLLAPGSLKQLVVQPVGVLRADSRIQNAVDVWLQDAQGTPVSERTQLTLHATGLHANSAALARILTADESPNEAGVQVFAQGGRVRVLLQGPDTPTEIKLTAEAGQIKQETVLRFMPALRPLVGVGVVQGALQLHKLKTSQLSNNGRDSFEQELRCMGRPTLSVADQAGQWDCAHKTLGDDRGQASLHTALYFKGAVKGEYLLTLAYDSAKDTRARVFRDLQPEAYYPIYGDASQRGFDANSTEKLYVRVDKGSSYVLYGDFVTTSLQTSRQLSQYSRSLTGVKAQLGDTHNQLHVFASKDALKQKVLEIPATGTSGPFALGATGVINSEQVQVWVRDRHNPASVLARTPLSRFVDYEVEPYTGRLILRAPLPSVDTQLNPQSLHIVLEQEDATQGYWTLGVQGHTTLGAHASLELGGVAVKELHDTRPKTLLGAYASAPLGAHTKLTVEAAQTQALSEDSATQQTGRALRLELAHKSEGLEARLQAQKADAHFDNPSAALTKNHTDVLGKLHFKLGAQTTLSADALHRQDHASGAVRNGLSLTLEQQLPQGVKLEGGVRWVDHSAGVSGASSASNASNASNVSLSPLALGAQPDDQYTSLRGKLTLPLSLQASAYVEAEHVLGDNQRRLWAIGGEYRLAQRGRFYVRHDLKNTLNSEVAFTAQLKNYTTLIGFDAPVYETAQANTQAFTEYRVKDAIGGQNAQAVLGLRQTFNLSQGLRLQASYERTHILSVAPGNTDAHANTAATLGLQYTQAANWKAGGRLEWRDTTLQTTWLGTLGGAYKVDRNWSALARAVWTHTQNADAAQGDQTKYRTQLGLAYRDVDRDRWNALMKIEQRGETNTETSGLGLKMTVHIASVHAHYQISRDWWVSGSAAYKRSAEQGGASTGTLLTSRLNWDFTHRWDLGLRIYASRVSAGLDSYKKQGLGLELGYMIHENTWLSLGYNVWGVKDRDLTLNEYTDKGWYVRLRHKFDETLLGGPANHSLGNSRDLYNKQKISD